MCFGCPQPSCSFPWWIIDDAFRGATAVAREYGEPRGHGFNRHDAKVFVRRGIKQREGRWCGKEGGSLGGSEVEKEKNVRIEGGHVERGYGSP